MHEGQPPCQQPLEKRRNNAPPPNSGDGEVAGEESRLVCASHLGGSRLNGSLWLRRWRTPLVVAADAGMLSATNLKALDELGVSFIVGSRTTKAPGDLESHFHWHGDVFTDKQIIDTVTPRHGNTRVNNTALRAEPVLEPRHSSRSMAGDLGMLSQTSTTRPQDTGRPRKPAPEPSSPARRRSNQPGSSPSAATTAASTTPPWPAHNPWSG
jgi:hypothetical protein